MFTTGEFSKIARVSRRTLRHYREIGLFEPVKSDAQNGYHYYSAGQLPQLHRILALRDLGLTLDQIQRALVEDVSIEEMRGMLQMKRAEVEKTLMDEIRRLKAIDSRLEMLAHGVPNLEVVLKSVPQQAYFSTSFICHSVEHGLQVTNDVLTALPARVNRSDLSYMVTILRAEGFAHFEDALENAEVEIGYLIQPDAAVSDIDLDGLAFARRVLPAATMASTVVNDIPENWYRGTAALGQWIEANHYQMDGYQREVWLEAPTPSRANPVIELQIPVRKLPLPGELQLQAPA